MYVFFSPQFGEAGCVRIIAENTGIADKFGKTPDASPLEVNDCGIVHRLAVFGEDGGQRNPDSQNFAAVNPAFFHTIIHQLAHAFKVDFSVSKGKVVPDMLDDCTAQVNDDNADMIPGHIQPDCVSRHTVASHRFRLPASGGLKHPGLHDQLPFLQLLNVLGNCRKTQIERLRNLLDGSSFTVIQISINGVTVHLFYFHAVQAVCRHYKPSGFCKCTLIILYSKENG
ncbi:hypothetical protein D3C73_846310 [compost metagenome]